MNVMEVGEWIPVKLVHLQVTKGRRTAHRVGRGSTQTSKAVFYARSAPMGISELNQKEAFAKSAQ